MQVFVLENSSRSPFHEFVCTVYQSLLNLYTYIYIYIYILAYLQKTRALGHEYE